MGTKGTWLKQDFTLQHRLLAWSLTLVLPWWGMPLISVEAGLELSGPSALAQGLRHEAPRGTGSAMSIKKEIHFYSHLASWVLSFQAQAFILVQQALH